MTAAGAPDRDPDESIDAVLDRLEAASTARERELNALAERVPAAVSRRRLVADTLRSLVPGRRRGTG